MNAMIYTLVRGADWLEAKRVGAYHGSADDRRDGFLHFSTAAQLRATAAKHRKGEAELWMIEAESAALGEALKWEPASGSSRPGLFPHLYKPLPLWAVRRAVHVPVAADGLHVFPPDIP